MKIFFDVDGTLLYSDGDGWVLRPGVVEVFAALQEIGHLVYLWTATGELHARRLVKRYGLDDLVVDCFDKDPVTAPVLPDAVVDDDAYLVEKYTGVHVQPFQGSDPNDCELQSVLEFFRDGGARCVS